MSSTDYRYPSYTQNYSAPAYSAPAYSAPAPAFNILDYTPIGILKNKIWCMATGIIVFMLLMFVISKIPVVGPRISSTIKYLITKNQRTTPAITPIAFAISSNIYCCIALVKSFSFI